MTSPVNISLWKADIEEAREAIRRLKLIRPERRPGHDAIARLKIDCKISEYQAIIRDRKNAIAMHGN